MSAGLYLEKLTLKNFATFDNQEIYFHKSFNGIVGETGSGKSLVLDAFQLLLGARSDKKLVRKSSDCAIVEGVFKAKSSEIKDYFDMEGFPLEESEIVIKRVIYQNGKSKAFLNHLSCPISALNKFSKSFVDLVGQFENQKLGSHDYQLYLLDQFSKNEDRLKNYQALFNEYLELTKTYEVLQIKVKEKEQREDYLKFQLNELQALNPTPEREKELVEKKAMLLNKEENAIALQSIQEILSEGENNTLQQIKLLQKILSKTSGLFGHEVEEKLDTVSGLLEDLSYDISRIDINGEDEEGLDQVLDELDSYQKIKRKFNATTEELIKISQSFQEEILSLSKMDSELETLQGKINETEEKLFNLAMEMHAIRQKKSLELEKLITKGLSELNMSGARFKINIQKGQKLNNTGLTQLSFTAETNPGEGFYNIKDIASGGELSRILLCLRQIVASEDSISIFFFDEIDTGIGGETATKVAEALKKVSQKSQVLAITHLPQIAKMVDEIIYVDKKSLHSDKSVRTISFVENKSGKQREKIIQQLAGLA
jgi:DNA repair protein RecN (Recombination protein N)